MIIEQLNKWLKEAALVKEVMVEVQSIYQRKTEQNQEELRHRCLLMTTLAHLIKEYIPLVNELEASIQILEAKHLVDQSTTFISRILINKLFTIFRTQTLHRVLGTKSRCIRSWRIRIQRTTGWTLRSLKTNTQCTSLTICQWLLNKAEESRKWASTIWSTNKWILFKPWTVLTFNKWTRWDLIWQWVWDFRAKASSVECRTLEQLLTTAEAQQWTWLGQTESKCTQCKCIKLTLQEAR